MYLRIKKNIFNSRQFPQGCEKVQIRQKKTQKKTGSNFDLTTD